MKGARVATRVPFAQESRLIWTDRKKHFTGDCARTDRCDSVTA